MTTTRPLFVGCCFTLALLILGTTPPSVFAQDVAEEDEVLFVTGWQDVPAWMPPLDAWPDAGAGFYMDVYFSYQTLTGQLERVFEEGGPGAGLRVGAAWERWVVAADVSVNAVGSGFEERLTSRLSLGLVVTHRVPLSWSWSLLLGVGGHYHWMPQCRDAPEIGEDTCVRVEDPEFDPQGPGLDLEVGLGWNLARAQEGDSRLRTDLTTLMRVSHVWLDNFPAQRTVNGIAVMFSVGIHMDLDFF